MKKTRYILALLIVLLLSLALFACGGGGDTHTAHTDNDSDGKCDVCGTTVETGEESTSHELALIKDGKINFQIVRSESSGGGVMMLLTSLEADVAKLGGTLKIVNDQADTEEAIEVLIGDVTSRGEKYTFDKYSLGMKGYMIKIVDNKILINAGSQDMLVDAVEGFIKDVLGIKSTTKTLSDVTMTADKEVMEIQDDYRITSISINGEEIKGYTIAYDFNNISHITAATALNKFLYEKAGYYLPLVKLENAGKSIIFEAVDYAGEDGFLVKTEESGVLKIQCAYKNAFDDAFNRFFNNELRLKTGDIDFGASYKYTDEVSIVYYKDYMHLSVDGNDYFALKAAHDFANECGQTVKAERNATYTIESITSIKDVTFGMYEPIVIKTNVQWGNAKFIIDDRYIDPLSEDAGNVFNVEKDHESINLSLEDDADVINTMFPGGKIDKDSFTEIENWPYDFPALVRLYNSEVRHYIRYGYDTKGDWQTEIIEVDKNGKIINDSELLFDYTKVTHVGIYRTDDTPITISGGEFTTKACQTAVTSTVYIDRGIAISRSGVVLDNVNHYVTDELDGINGNNGVSYSGFFVATHAAQVTIQNCVLTARKYYKIAGTYDFTASYVNGIYLKNCTQSNYYLLDENGNSTGVVSMSGNAYWGVGGTNYCKNMVYDTCELTRFDAHAGLYNGKIINSKVTAINLIGGGDMLIENCDIELTSTCIVMLRGDYGATWKGEITIKDCRVQNTKNTALFVYKAGWENHFYGYTCHLPNTIIDNLRIKNGNQLDLFTGVNLNSHTSANNNVNVIVPPSYIKVINNYANYIFKLPQSSFFSGTELENVTLT